MSHAPDETQTHRHRLRNIVGGSAGNLVEWYDWYIYAAFSLYFAPVFFPEGDPTSQLNHVSAHVRSTASRLRSGRLHVQRARAPHVRSLACVGKEVVIHAHHHRHEDDAVVEQM